MQGEIETKRKTSDLDLVFKKYCRWVKPQSLKFDASNPRIVWPHRDTATIKFIFMDNLLPSLILHILIGEETLDTDDPRKTSLIETRVEDKINQTLYWKSCIIGSEFTDMCVKHGTPKFRLKINI